MTPQERRNPDILKASRKKRIASGSGMKVEDVNKLLKQHRQMADMMKSMSGNKRGGALAKMGQALGLPGGGMGGMGMGGMGMGGMPQPTPEQIAALQKQFGGMPGAPGPGAAGGPAAKPAPLPPGLAPRLPGRGAGGIGGNAAPQPGRLPGLGGGGVFSGLNPFGKKK